MRQNFRGLFLTFFFACCAGSLFAQFDLSDWQSSAAWTDGTILTNDDEELKGKVRYDDLQSILFFRDGAVEKAFVSRQIKMFRFFDPVKKSDRLFYSLEFEDRKFNVKRPLFFELIKEFKTFAVLTKVDPVQFNEAPGQPRGTQNNSMKELNAVMRIQQFETICFMSPEGLIEPYLEIEILIKNGIFEERVRNRQTILDEKLFEKYFGERANEKIMTFVKHNELQLTNKEDLLKVLDYYEKYLIN